MGDSWWYIWNFLLGAGGGTAFVVVFMKVAVFLFETFSDNPKT